MLITKPTYLIAELVGDVESLVFEMRKRFNPDNQLWPADITIAGSSGVGTLALGQSIDDVAEQFTPVIEKFGFNDVSFIGIDKFPNSGIYYLQPERAKFDKLHQTIINTNVKFRESEWPYNPHCTLRWQDHDALEYKTFFESVRIPTMSSIGCFSLYQPETKGGCRVHRF